MIQLCIILQHKIIYKNIYQKLVIYLNVELVLQMKKLIYIVQQLINILWNNSITKHTLFRGICRDTRFLMTRASVARSPRTGFTNHSQHLCPQAGMVKYK